MTNPAVKTSLVNITLGLLGCLALLLAFFIIAPNLIKIPVDDENIYIYQGLLVAQGKIPYRDFFDFVTPGSFMINGIFIKIFQPTLIGLRLLALFCLITCTGITLTLGKNHLPKIALWITALLFWFIHIPITMQVTHHLYSTTLGLLSVSLLSQAIRTNQSIHHVKKHSMLSGVACGLSLLCTQSLGIILLFSLTGFLFLYHVNHTQQSPKQALIQVSQYFVLPALLPLLLACLWLFSHHALNHFIYATMMWLIEGGYSKTTSHWYFGEGLLKMISPTGKGSFYIAPLPEFTQLLLQGGLPILGLLWAAQITWKQYKNQALNWSFVLLFVSAAAFMMAAMSFPNRVMIAFHGWLAYLLGIMAVYQCLKKKPVLIKLGIIGFFTLCFFWTEALIYRAATMAVNPKYISFGTVETHLTALPHTPKQTIHWQNEQVTAIHDNTPVSKTFFAYNLKPQWYLLSNRHNPTRFQYLLHTYNTPKQIQEAALQIKKHQPTYILYDQKDALYFKYDRRFEHLRHTNYHLHSIEKIIEQDYQAVNTHNSMTLYKTKSNH